MQPEGEQASRRRPELTFMRRALRLAERGRGLTSPNPPVGAVVVAGEEISGEGYHRGPGLPHAEIEALTAAGDRARGATLYLTMEPCTVQGRTPPCVPALIDAGVARVVIATADPNPAVDGRGIDALTAAGIDVTVGVLEADARHLIAPFAKHIRTGIPFVTLKIAATLDGRVAASDGSARWITGVTARRDVHRLRGASDAVLTGVGTVLADDPRLSCRLRGFQGRQPLRVVLDSAARTPPEARILEPEAPTLIATTEKAPEEALRALRTRGADILLLTARDGRVDLRALLEELGRRGVVSLLIEAGPTVAGEAVEQGLVDRFVFYLAPKLLGPAGLAAVGGLVAPTVAHARELSILSVRSVGADVKIEAGPRP